MIPRLLLLLDDPETNSDALADLVHADAGLTADVLHVANSSLYSRGSRTQTLLEAVNRIGLREMYRIAMRIVASPVLERTQHGALGELDLWRHSLTAAVAAQVLAQHTAAEDAEVAFTAGLLHDIGKVLIAQALGTPYAALARQCKLENKSLFNAEQRAFRITHAEAGAKLLRRWSFPDKIISAVDCHHHPLKALRPHARLAALVYAADILAYRVSQADGYPDYVVHPDPACLDLVDLNPQSLLQYVDEVKEALQREQLPFH